MLLPMFPNVGSLGLLWHVPHQHQHLSGRRPRISMFFKNYDQDCSFHNLSYLILSHLVAHNFLRHLKMFVVSLTKHSHPQSSSDMRHFDTQPRHPHYCSNRINKSHGKPTFSLKGEGRVYNKGKAFPWGPTQLYNTLLYTFSFFFKKMCLFPTPPIDNQYPFHKSSLEPYISFNYFMNKSQKINVFSTFSQP